MKETQGQLKYYILMETIKKDIRNGIIKSGDKLPSENQFTAKYGVSRYTVRKALSILANDGYILVEHGVGSFCANTKFTKGRSKNIAVVTTYISNYIFPRVIQGIDNVLTEQGYSIILKNTKNNRALELKCLEDIFEKNIDGMIIEPSKSQIYVRHLDIFDRFDDFNIPYVFLHGTHPQLRNKPFVIIDDEKGMYLVVKYLIDLGHKNIVGIFKTDDNQGFLRHKGYVKALNEAGIMYNPEKVIWYHTEDKVLKPKAEVIELVRRDIALDSIACYNDEIAYSVLDALLELNIKVPEDISLTGFDNSHLVYHSSIGITTVEHPKEELGAIAAELLLELIKGAKEGEINTQRIVEPKLIIKNSCLKRN